jgi:hydrogenase maturation protein HypF
MESDRIIGAVIRVSGIVQGVGFRPFIYRRAARFGLKGSVRNTDTGVLINVDGPRGEIEKFYREIRLNPPAVAEVHSSSLDFTEPAGFETFTIAQSVQAEFDGSSEASPEGAGITLAGKVAGFTPVSPDIGTCGECLADISNPGNRRYRYAFTNCTNCGPRFTIIRSIPYDRPNTTMRVFPMCGPCEKEYHDPGDRRYHAQPNACPECGPSLKLVLPDGRPLGGEPIAESVRLLEEGKVIAIKGLGGYHLAADPFNRGAVRLLRERKRRQGKPFALMARDLEVVKRYCRLSANEGALLLSPERPILLLEKKEADPRKKAEAGMAPLCGEVAPDTSLLGVMLPYTPLHHLIFNEGSPAEGPELLVMTSGNLSEEPLVYKDGEAFRDLAPLADAFLTHNREVQRPCDDSVLMPAGALTVPIRRSRGYVPRGIDVGMQGGQVLAAGAQEKNTFCVLKGGKAFLSHHVGDLNNEKSVDAYLQGIEDFLAMFRVRPDAIACDLHPDYVSTRFAEERARSMGVPLYRVQHHHAHIAALLGEKGMRKSVIGVAFDGTGYGPDGTIWGGEFLVADRGEYERVGRFAPVPMPGGEKSILETDRMGIAYLLSAFGSLAAVPDIPFLEATGHERLALMEQSVRSGVNCPLTSSCGRLFDAVSSVLGLCTRPSYDAQGAILLETAAGVMTDLDEPYPYDIDADGVVRFNEMIRAIVGDLAAGRGGMKGSGKASSSATAKVRANVASVVPANTAPKIPPSVAAGIARRFHSTVVRAAVDSCVNIGRSRGINTVALSGGAFQNRILLGLCVRELEGAGFSVLVHTRVPPNDGGIALGQGVAALTLMERGIR